MATSSQRVTQLLLVGSLVILVLQFFTYDADTKKYIDIITYASVLQPLWALYQQRRWPTMTLLLSVIVVHIIQETCTDWDACVPGFDLVKQLQEQSNQTAVIVDELARQEINNILTVFSFIHLFASAAEKPEMLATLQPLLILVAVLSVFIDQAALALIVIGLFATARNLRNFKKFSLVDYLLFLGLTTTSIVFFFLNMKGYFYVLYTMSFTFAAHAAKKDDKGVERGGWLLGLMSGDSPGNIPDDYSKKDGSFGEGLSLTRVDIE